MDTTDWTVDDHIEWMRHHAKTIMVMERLRLNVKVTSMVHYDIPWLDYAVADHLDALAVQQALLDLGPNPVLVRKAIERERGECGECGGTKEKHYLDCSIWPHNHKAA